MVSASTSATWNARATGHAAASPCGSTRSHKPPSRGSKAHSSEEGRSAVRVLAWSGLGLGLGLGLGSGLGLGLGLGFGLGLGLGSG